MVILTVGVIVTNWRSGEAFGATLRQGTRKSLVETHRALILDYEITGGPQTALMIRNSTLFLCL